MTMARTRQPTSVRKATKSYAQPTFHRASLLRRNIMAFQQVVVGAGGDGARSKDGGGGGGSGRVSCGGSGGGGLALLLLRRMHPPQQFLRSKACRRSRGRSTALLTASVNPASLKSSSGGRAAGGGGQPRQRQQRARSPQSERSIGDSDHSGGGEARAPLPLPSPHIVMAILHLKPSSKNRSRAASDDNMMVAAAARLEAPKDEDEDADAMASVSSAPEVRWTDLRATTTTTIEVASDDDLEEEGPEDFHRVAAFYEEMDSNANAAESRARAIPPPVPPSLRSALCEDLVEDDEAKRKAGAELLTEEEVGEDEEEEARAQRGIEEAAARGSAVALAEGDALAKRRVSLAERIGWPTARASLAESREGGEGAATGSRSSSPEPSNGNGDTGTGTGGRQDQQVSYGDGPLHPSSHDEEDLPMLAHSRLSVSADGNGRENENGPVVLEATLVEGGDVVYDARPIEDHDQLSLSSHTHHKTKSNKRFPQGSVYCWVAFLLAAAVSVGAGAYLGTRDGNKGGGDDELKASLRGGQLNVTVSGLESDDEPVADGTATDDPTMALWQQVGSNIDGEAELDRSGVSSAISNDGKVLAIGAYGNNGAAGADAGHVRIYVWDETVGDWTQRGPDLDGGAEGDFFGWSVALSGDGSVVAVGSPMHGLEELGQAQVFAWDESLSIYTPLGTLHEINGNKWERLGWAVDLSDDGMTVAVGAPNLDKGSGLVRVYEWNSTASNWIAVGPTIETQYQGEEFGRSLSLSADGNILAIGAPFYNGTIGENQGRVEVLTRNDDNDEAAQWDGYHWISASNWIAMGDSIVGEGAHDGFGWSIDLSADGLTLAIGAHKDDGNGEDSGQGRVYSWDADELGWTQMGSDINGEYPGDVLGRSVSLSADGNAFAIAAPFNSDNGPDSGHARVYSWNAELLDWKQVGQDINGEKETDRVNRVALSADGTTLLVSAWNADGDAGPRSGVTRVFNISLQQQRISPSSQSSMRNDEEPFD